MSGLKNCPFCGDAAMMFKAKRGFHVGCNTAGCIAESGLDVFYGKPEWAAYAWNTRANAYLWSISPGVVPSDHAALFVSTATAIVEARKILLSLLTDDQRSAAIAKLRNELTNGEYLAAPSPDDARGAHGQ